MVAPRPLVCSPCRRSGEAKGIPADIRASQPTIFCSVPRVFERFEVNVMDKVGQFRLKAIIAIQ